MAAVTWYSVLICNVLFPLVLGAVFGFVLCRWGRP